MVEFGEEEVLSMESCERLVFAVKLKVWRLVWGIGEMVVLMEADMKVMVWRLLVEVVDHSTEPS